MSNPIGKFVTTAVFVFFIHIGGGRHAIYTPRAEGTKGINRVPTDLEVSNNGLFIAKLRTTFYLDWL